MHSAGFIALRKTEMVAKYRFGVLHEIAQPMQDKLKTKLTAALTEKWIIPIKNIHLLLF